MGSGLFVDGLVGKGWVEFDWVPAMCQGAFCWGVLIYAAKVVTVVLGGDLLIAGVSFLVVGVLRTMCRESEVL